MALPPSTLLQRGLRRRCPVCSHGNLFRAWFRMVPRCPGCGLRFPREEGQWLGSWFLNVCVVQTILVIALAAAVGISWPVRPSWPWLVGVVVAAVVVPLAFFPWSRTIWVAIDLCMRPLGLDDGVAPGTELDQLARRPDRPLRRSARWGGPRPVQGPRPVPGARRARPGPDPGDPSTSPGPAPPAGP